MTDNARLPERIDEGPLIIRRWHRDDAEAMTSMITKSLDHLRPWMAWARSEPLTIEQRHRQISRWGRYWESGRGVVYGVFDQTEVIGGAALHRRVGMGGLDIGYWLGVGHTGQGHASRIAAALTTAACAHPGISFTQISHEESNTTSAAVAQRLLYEDKGITVHGTVEVRTWRRSCSSTPGW